MLLLSISVFVSVAIMLMSVALVTLLERKILAFSQSRLGPSKILLKGLVQPIMDGVKLLQKSFVVPWGAMKELLILAPIVLIMNMVMVWLCVNTVPYQGGLWAGGLLFIMVLSLSVYGSFFVGFSGASKYSFIGGMRSCVQSVSYEVSLAMIIFSIIMLSNHVSLVWWGSSVFWLCLPLWFISVVVEVNRAPFDLAEGESELISGLNIELSSVLFALVLVGEYGFVIVLSWLTASFLFLGAWGGLVLVLFSMLFVRSVLPRLKYDKLMSLCWVKILPLVILWVVWVISFMVI